MDIFECGGAGYPRPEITWSKDGGPIERHLGSAKQQKWSLELEEATTYDSGNYTCRVSNDYGTATFTFKLMIQGTRRRRRRRRHPYFSFSLLCLGG